MRNKNLFCLLLFAILSVAGIRAQDPSPPAVANTDYHQTPAPTIFAVPVPAVSMSGLTLFLIKLNEVPPRYDDDELCWDTCYELIQADATIQNSPPTPAPVNLNYDIWNATATEQSLFTNTTCANNANAGYDLYRRQCSATYNSTDSARASHPASPNQYPLRC